MEHKKEKIALFQKENEILIDMVRELRREVKELKMTKEEKDEDLAQIRADLEVKLNVNAFGNLINMRSSTIEKEKHKKEETKKSEESKSKKLEDDDEKLLIKDDISSDNLLELHLDVVDQRLMDKMEIKGDDDSFPDESLDLTEELEGDILDHDSLEEVEDKEHDDDNNPDEVPVIDLIDSDNDEEFDDDDDDDGEDDEDDDEEEETKGWAGQKAEETEDINQTIIEEVKNGEEGRIGEEVNGENQDSFYKSESDDENENERNWSEGKEKVADDKEEGCDSSTVDELCKKYKNVIKNYGSQESFNQEGINADSQMELSQSKPFENFENLFSEFRSTEESAEEESPGNDGETPVNWKRGEGAVSWNDGEKALDWNRGEETGENSSWGDPGLRGEEEPVRKRKRAMCGNCAACLKSDCDNCRNCLDKPRNGGENIRRQKCALRKCNPGGF